MAVRRNFSEKPKWGGVSPNFVRSRAHDKLSQICLSLRDVWLIRCGVSRHSASIERAVLLTIKAIKQKLT
jgi:hypothetical protein